MGGTFVPPWQGASSHVFFGAGFPLRCCRPCCDLSPRAPRALLWRGVHAPTPAPASRSPRASLLPPPWSWHSLRSGGPVLVAGVPRACPPCRSAPRPPRPRARGSPCCGCSLERSGRLPGFPPARGPGRRPCSAPASFPPALPHARFPGPCCRCRPPGLLCAPWCCARGPRSPRRWPSHSCRSARGRPALPGSGPMARPGWFWVRAPRPASRLARPCRRVPASPALSFAAALPPSPGGVFGPLRSLGCLCRLRIFVWPLLGDSVALPRPPRLCVAAVASDSSLGLCPLSARPPRAAGVVADCTSRDAFWLSPPAPPAFSLIPPSGRVVPALRSFFAQPPSPLRPFASVPRPVPGLIARAGPPCFSRPAPGPPARLRHASRVPRPTPASRGGLARSGPAVCPPRPARLLRRRPRRRRPPPIPWLASASRARAWRSGLLARGSCPAPDIPARWRGAAGSILLSSSVPLPFPWALAPPRSFPSAVALAVGRLSPGWVPAASLLRQAVPRLPRWWAHAAVSGLPSEPASHRLSLSSLLRWFGRRLGALCAPSRWSSVEVPFASSGARMAPLLRGQPAAGGLPAGSAPPPWWPARPPLPSRWSAAPPAHAGHAPPRVDCAPPRPDLPRLPLGLLLTARPRCVACSLGPAPPGACSGSAPASCFRLCLPARRLAPSPPRRASAFCRPLLPSLAPLPPAPPSPPARARPRCGGALRRPAGRCAAGGCLAVSASPGFARRLLWCLRLLLPPPRVYAAALEARTLRAGGAPLRPCFPSLRPAVPTRPRVACCLAWRRVRTGPVALGVPAARAFPPWYSSFNTTRRPRPACGPGAGASCRRRRPHAPELFCPLSGRTEPALWCRSVLSAGLSELCRRSPLVGAASPALANLRLPSPVHAVTCAQRVRQPAAALRVRSPNARLRRLCAWPSPASSSGRPGDVRRLVGFAGAGPFATLVVAACAAPRARARRVLPLPACACRPGLSSFRLLRPCSLRAPSLRAVAVAVPPARALHRRRGLLASGSRWLVRRQIAPTAAA